MFSKSSKPRVRYLVEEDGRFAYRRRVPDDVTPHVGAHIWKDRFKPGTTRLEAERLVREKAHEHDNLIRQARGLPVSVKLEAWDFLADETQSLLLFNPDDTDAAADFKKASDAAAKLERVMLAAAEQRLDTLRPEERWAIEKVGGLNAFFRRWLQESQRVESNEIALGLARAIGRDTERDDAVHAVDARRVTKDEHTLKKLDLLPSEGDSTFDDPNNPRIKSVLKPWFDARKQGASAIKRHTTAIERFAEMHGNPRVKQITREMVKAYAKTIENLTDHRHLPTSQRGTLTVVNDLPKVSAPTVERHLISMKAALNFCVEEGWIAVNPATGVKAPKDTRPHSSKRRAMTREERIQFLNRAIAEYGEDGSYVWLIKLAAYLGTRLEEIAQLARSSVRKFDGVWCVDINDRDGRSLKTHYSVRAIPLHPVICDDFLAWLAKTDTPNRHHVFPMFAKRKDGRNPSKLSGDMGRLMDRAGIADPSVVMHSFRHGLTHAMTDVGIDGDVRRHILGQKVKDAHGDYLHVSPETKLKNLKKVKPLFGEKTTDATAKQATQRSRRSAQRRRRPATTVG